VDRVNWNAGDVTILAVLLGHAMVDAQFGLDVVKRCTNVIHPVRVYERGGAPFTRLRRLPSSR